jgi:ADP-ribosyl-[dinitrogen reductase] hydrolase
MLETPSLSLQSTTDRLLAAATGAMIGACIGDAAGAPLEFTTEPTETNIVNAICMNGGGFWNTAAGQVTDDGELTLSLARALCTAKDGVQARENAAIAYQEWFQSKPFDIGTTTRAAFGAPRQYANSVARGMAEAAADKSMGSKSNGSMMRATPLAIWGYKLSDEDLAHLVRNDCTLSHPNEAVVSATIAYVLAVRHLLLKPDDRKGAWEVVIGYFASKDCNEETREWIQQVGDRAPVAFRRNIGCVKIAFVNAFQHLINGSPFRDAIDQTIRAGGDTDTNACIVGGLIGAADGAALIPAYMSHAVLTCNISKGGQPYRPAYLSTKNIPNLVDTLLKVAPSSLLGDLNEQ